MASTTFSVAAVYRTICHLIRMKQGLLRIVDLDVDDYGRLTK